MELPNFVLYNCIGKACNGFANVYLANRRVDSKTLAVRVCPLEYTGVTLSELLHEITVTRSLKHANVVNLEEVLISGSYLCLISPVNDFGSVTDLIHARFIFGLSEAAIMYILYDILKAVDYVHSRDFIHRGIRCSHILISSDGRAILTGFRNAISIIQDGRRVSTMHEFRPEFKQNLLWLAPEVLQQNMAGYGSKSDVYSVGISTCEMANGFPPFSDMAHMQMLFEKLRGTTPRLLDASTLVTDDLPKSGDGGGDSMINEQKERRFSPHLHNFTELCLRSNPAERPCANELLNHPFFKPARRHRPSFRDIFHPVRPLVQPKSVSTSAEGHDPVLDSAACTISEPKDLDHVNWQFE